MLGDSDDFVGFFRNLDVAQPKAPRDKPVGSRLTARREGRDHVDRRGAAGLSAGWIAVALYLGARMKSWTRADARY